MKKSILFLFFVLSFIDVVFAFMSGPISLENDISLFGKINRVDSSIILNQSSSSSPSGGSVSVPSQNQTEMEETIPVSQMWFYILVFVFIISIGVFLGIKQNRNKFKKWDAALKHWFIVAASKTKNKKK